MAIVFTAALWAIKLAELALGMDLARYSIFPGNPATLTGIFFAPLLHGSLGHLFANTAPMLVLGTALLYGYPKAARVALPILYLGSGLAVWLFARPSWHLGASGLAFGLLFFLFTMGVVRWERRAIALSLAVFLLYGGMIWGLLPTDPRVSFESHLTGAALGLLLAVLLQRLDPPAPEKTYGWEPGDGDQDGWPFDERPGEEDAIGDRPPPASVRGPDNGKAADAVSVWRTTSFGLPAEAGMMVPRVGMLWQNVSEERGCRRRGSGGRADARVIGASRWGSQARQGVAGRRARVALLAGGGPLGARGS